MHKDPRSIMGIIWLATGVLLVISNAIELISFGRSEYRSALTGQIIVTCVTLALAIGSIFGAIALLGPGNWGRVVIWSIASIYALYSILFILFAFLNGFRDLDRLNAGVVWVLGASATIPFWLYSLKVMYLGILATISFQLLRK